MLPEGSKSSNFITIEETFYIENIGKGFKEYILKDVYQDWLESKKVKPKETKLERRMRYSLLMKENGWTRAELSRKLGVSRAWVTMTLG
jgi:DnaJ-domain-containing protein 1